MQIHNREYFYKYVTADVAKKILNTLQVKLSSPTLFNDPFDSQIPIQHDVKSKEDLIHQVSGVVCNRLEPILKDAKNAHDLVYKEMLKDSHFVSQQVKLLEDSFKEINEKTVESLKRDRIFCVSEIYDNLLMWAHYADDHKGAVIKLKCISEKLTALCAAKPVRYSANMPILGIKDLFAGPMVASLKIIEEILYTKSSDWAYEKEWRFTLGAQNNDQSFDLRSLREEELNSIYLGCCMSNSDKQEILDIVRTKRKSVKVFEAYKNQREFKLDFIESGTV